MSYRSLYDTHFAACLNKIEKVGRFKETRLRENIEDFESMFVLEDDRFNLAIHNSTVEFAYRATGDCLARLFASMLRGVVDVELRYKNGRLGESSGSLPLLVIDGTEAVEFVLSADSGDVQGMRDRAAWAKPKSMTIVLASDCPSDVWMDVWRDSAARLHEELGVDANAALLREFFGRYFSEDDYREFEASRDFFVLEARRRIGKGVVDLPSKAVMEKFADACKEELVEVEAFELLEELRSKGIAESDLVRLRPSMLSQSFLTKLFDLELAFSKSFVSGEWFYGIASLSSGSLEKTSAVAGCLKAVEQLLRQVIRNWTMGGRKRPIALYKDKDTGEMVLARDEGERRKALEKPLCLECFFRLDDNRALLDCSDALAKECLERLECWRHDRNAYFHEGSIASDDTAKKVRQNVRRLLILLFAYVRFDGLSFSERPSGMSASVEVEESIEARFGKWVSQILSDPETKIAITDGADLLDLVVLRRPERNRADGGIHMRKSVVARLVRKADDEMALMNALFADVDDFEWDDSVDFLDLREMMMRLARIKINENYGGADIGIRVSEV